MSRYYESEEERKRKFKREELEHELYWEERELEEERRQAAREKRNPAKNTNSNSKTEEP